MQSPSVNARDVEMLLESNSWHEHKSLLHLLGQDAARATALGYKSGPDPLHPEFAFVAVAVGEHRRSFVLLRQPARSAVLVTFDLLRAPGASYVLEGFSQANVRGSVVAAALPSRRWSMNGEILLPRPGEATIDAGPQRVSISPRTAASETLFLCAMQFSDGAGSPATTELVESVDLAGLRIAEWVILFHNEAQSARDPQFFFLRRSGHVRCLVTGLAPGAWELWHNGFVKEPSLEVTPRAGALYFEGDAGDYFFRRYS